MEKNYHPKNQRPDYRPVLFDKLKNIRNGSISIIKQDSVVVQIDVNERIRLGVVSTGLPGDCPLPPYQGTCTKLKIREITAS
jgi:hypothetical protein